MARLPNGDRAVVDEGKLTGYCLNLEHSHGGPKARVFRSFLGLTVEHAAVLQEALLEAAARDEAEPRLEDQHGRRFEVKFMMQGPNGNSAEITSGWIMDAGEDFPRLTSCYIRI